MLLRKPLLIVLFLLLVLVVIISPLFKEKSKYANRQIILDAKNQTIKINYPFFNNPMADSDINSFINRQIAAFKQLPPPPKNIPVEYTYSLYITYDKPFISDRLASFPFYLSVFSGGAHPDNSVITKNYNLTDKRLLSINDVLALNKKNKIQLQALLVNILVKQLNNPDPAWIKEGVEKSSLQDFCLNKESLIFFFLPADVAPYVYGVVKAPVSYKELKGMFKSSVF